MEISKMLTLSTTHMSLKTAQSMEKGEDFGLVIYEKLDYGWFILVDPEVLDADESGVIPADLYHLLHVAKNHDCRWLDLDCDGNVEPDLPAYDW